MDDNRENPPTDKEGKSTGTGAGIRLPEVLLHDAYEKMSKAELASAAGLFEDVLKRFGSAIEDDQKSLVHSELGTLYYWLGDYEAGKHHCERGLAFSDQNDQAYTILGKIAVAQFQFPKARGYFSKISDDNPARSLGMCLVSIKLRDKNGVEIFLKEAHGKIASPSTHPEYGVYHAYSMLLRGDAKTAVAEARNFIKKCEREPALLLVIAEIFMTAGHYGEARSVVEKVQKSCPENDQTFAILAHSAYAQEDWSEADSYAREAVRFNPANAYAKTILMKLATRNGSYAVAEEIGMQILSDCPEYSLGHANLGDVYFNQGRYELAEIEYDQTQQLMNADTKGARLRKARMKFIKSDFAGSAEILEELIGGYHTYYDDAMCDLVLCYDQLGDEEKKSEMLDKMAFRRSFYHRTEKILKSFGE
jgi:tetratricopeptide (TPR) repeat protein